MTKFTNPLDNIRIAVPCGADWNEMRGNDRMRFCGECKLNVYNLSGLTQNEAENLLMASEGRVCMRVFKRSDGTVITKDCPVGWEKMKRRVSRTATAVFALIAGFVGGVGFLGSLKALRAFTNYEVVPQPFFEDGEDRIMFGGGISNLPELKLDILKKRGIPRLRR